MFRRLNAGDPLQISATDWNMMCTAVEQYMAQAGGQSAFVGSASTSPAEVTIRNDTETTVPVGGVLKISGVAITPEANENGFKFQTTVKGDTPKGKPSGETTWEAKPEVLAIAREPIRPGKLGLAVVAGVVPCRLLLTDTRIWYANAVIETDTTDGTVKHLATDWAGQLPIIWREDGTQGSEIWALVNLSGGGVPVIKMCKLKDQLENAGSSAGEVDAIPYEFNPRVGYWNLAEDTEDNYIRVVSTPQFEGTGYLPKDSICCAIRESGSGKYVVISASCPGGGYT